VALNAKVGVARASRAIFAGAAAVEGDAFVERSACPPATILDAVAGTRSYDRGRRSAPRHVVRADRSEAHSLRAIAISSFW